MAPGNLYGGLVLQLRPQGSSNVWITLSPECFSVYETPTSTTPQRVIPLKDIYLVMRNMFVNPPVLYMWTPNDVDVAFKFLDNPPPLPASVSSEPGNVYKMESNGSRESDRLEFLFRRKLNKETVSNSNCKEEIFGDRQKMIEWQLKVKQTYTHKLTFPDIVEQKEANAPSTSTQTAAAPTTPAVVPPATANPPVFGAYCKQFTTNGVKVQWLVVTNTHFLFYDDHQSNVSKRSIPLSDVSIMIRNMFHTPPLAYFYSAKHRDLLFEFSDSPPPLPEPMAKLEAFRREKTAYDEVNRLHRTWGRTLKLDDSTSADPTPDKMTTILGQFELQTKLKGKVKNKDLPEPLVEGEEKKELDVQLQSQQAEAARKSAEHEKERVQMEQKMKAAEEQRKKDRDEAVGGESIFGEFSVNYVGKGTTPGQFISTWTDRNITLSNGPGKDLIIPTKSAYYYAATDLKEHQLGLLLWTESGVHGFNMVGTNHQTEKEFKNLLSGLDLFQPMECCRFKFKIESFFRNPTQFEKEIEEMTGRPIAKPN